jgi:hypothetical protein
MKPDMKMVAHEFDSIIYDLFDKVSFRMWGNGKCKDEIRQIQDRLRTLKRVLLDDDKDACTGNGDLER